MVVGGSVVPPPALADSHLSCLGTENPGHAIRLVACGDPTSVVGGCHACAVHGGSALLSPDTM